MQMTACPILSPLVVSEPIKSTICCFHLLISSLGNCLFVTRFDIILTHTFTGVGSLKLEIICFSGSTYYRHCGVSKSPYAGCFSSVNGCCHLFIQSSVNNDLTSGAELHFRLQHRCHFLLRRQILQLLHAFIHFCDDSIDVHAAGKVNRQIIPITKFRICFCVSTALKWCCVCYTLDSGLGLVIPRIAFLSVFPSGPGVTAAAGRVTSPFSIMPFFIVTYCIPATVSYKKPLRYFLAIVAREGQIPHSFLCSKKPQSDASARYTGSPQ